MRLGEKRKALLRKRGVTLTSIARQTGYTMGHISQVLHGTRRHERTERFIAKAIGLPISTVFRKAA